MSNKKNPVRKHVSITREMDEKLKELCRQENIESESEAIRYALNSYLEKSYSDETLKLQGVRSLRRDVEALRDMTDAMFKYICRMHTNLLGYLPEIDSELKDSAFNSAKFRHEKFFTVFQNSLKSDAPFFEKLLARFYTEDNSG
jgi:Arc/MetJ-type ribon-helix-helix transcriptional regulator